MDDDLERLAAQINSLGPVSKLRLAADLLEHNKFKIAHSIVAGVAAEMGAVLSLQLERRKP